TYKGGYPYFSDCAPREGKGSLDDWAWDWLNLMFYEFHFQRETAKEQWLNLSIWLFSDTGYFISDERTREQTDVSTFVPVERLEQKSVSCCIGSGSRNTSNSEIIRNISADS